MKAEHMTTEQAKNAIRKAPKGSRFALHVRGDAPIVDTDSVFPGGLASYINLSRPQALKLVSDMLSTTLEARGARIPVGQYNTTVWIG